MVTKRCWACGMDIPISAIKCPYCREEQYISDDELPDSSEKNFLWAKIVGAITAILFFISFLIPGELGIGLSMISMCPFIVTLCLVLGGYRIDYKKAPDEDKKDEALYNSKSVGAKIAVAGLLLGIIGLLCMIGCSSDDMVFKSIAIIFYGIFALTIGLLMYFLDKLDD